MNFLITFLAASLANIVCFAIVVITAGIIEGNKNKPKKNEE